MKLLDRRNLPALLCLPLGVVGDWLIARGITVVGDAGLLASRGRGWDRVFSEGGLATEAWVLAATCVLAGTFMVVASLAGALRVPRAPRLIRWSITAAYVCLVIYLAVLWDAVRMFADAKLLPGNSSMDVFHVRLEWAWWAVALVGGLAVLHVQWLRRSVLESFSTRCPDPILPPTGPAVGDKIVENLRSHGREPVFRRSVYSSFMLHLSLIIIIPWLMSLRGCVEDVKMPPGTGEASTIVQMEIKKQVKKKEKKKRYVVPKEAAISFYVPTLDDSKVEKEVDAQTNQTYQAGIAGGARKGATRGKSGKRGSGGPGGGGWPGGMDDGIFQFYRIEYAGSKDWDDGMTTGNADKNFLDYLRRQVPYPVAPKGKSVHIGQLPQFNKGLAPPFVYMTGNGRISTSRKEEQALREYCLGGGMLFADCGGHAWDGAFRSFMGRVFPDLPLVTISKEDVLFQEPNPLGIEGPSPLWRHGGSEFKGVKSNGRWLVFYHPGDCNDAWKDGNNGLREDLYLNAFMVGDNVTYYAVTRYLEETAKYRKR